LKTRACVEPDDIEWIDPAPPFPLAPGKPLRLPTENRKAEGATGEGKSALSHHARAMSMRYFEWPYVPRARGSHRTQFGPSEASSTGRVCPAQAGGVEKRGHRFSELVVLHGTSQRSPWRTYRPSFSLLAVWDDPTAHGCSFDAPCTAEGKDSEGRSGSVRLHAPAEVGPARVL
jgi:hypothetical protein